jgi:ABC-type multidrug transport system permease subunit
MHLFIPSPQNLVTQIGNSFSEFKPRAVNSSSQLQYEIAGVALVVTNFVPSSGGFCGLEAAAGSPCSRFRQRGLICSLNTEITFKCKSAPHLSELIIDWRLDTSSAGVCVGSLCAARPLN